MPPKLATLWGERDWLLDLAKIGLRTVGRSQAPVLECRQGPEQVDLNKLPALVSWPEDGGRFITLPLVYTEHPETGQHNLGMYRVQLFSSNQTGMHWQIHKGGGFHHYAAEQLGRSLPATVFLGGPPALTLAAIAAMPEMVPELLFASFLMGDKLNLAKVEDHWHSMVAEAEFALAGEVPPNIRRPEGPFGDHYGYYSVVHDFPVFNVQTIYHRRDAIYPATVVGKPRQEDYYIGDYFQSLLSPLFPVIMPGVKDLWTYAETGFHSLAAAVVRESYYREALAHAFRILGEGQLSLTKFLIVTDVSCNLHNFEELLENVLQRFHPERDLLIIHETAMDTLDYTGRKFNQGSKAIMTGLGPTVRDLPREYRGETLPGVKKIKPYCAGCLLVSGESFVQDTELPNRLVSAAGAQTQYWPLIIVLDDIDGINDQTSFLWTVFTRFDPAFDLYAAQTIQHNKISYQGSIIIDARMKPPYPGELIPPKEIVNKVSDRWKEYFGRGAVAGYKN
jgi:UbiD family decarboxylase